MVLMPAFIRLMRHEGVDQQVRNDGSKAHLSKQGTPTMGGGVMMVAIAATCAIQARWEPSLVLAVMLATSAISLLDDLESVMHGRSLGLTPSQKMVGPAVVSVAFCLVATNLCGGLPDGRPAVRRDDRSRFRSPTSRRRAGRGCS